MDRCGRNILYHVRKTETVSRKKEREHFPYKTDLWNGTHILMQKYKIKSKIKINNKITRQYGEIAEIVKTQATVKL